LGGKIFVEQRHVNAMQKIVIHAPDVINNALVPIGELTEEAAESKNKDIILGLTKTQI